MMTQPRGYGINSFYIFACFWLLIASAAFAQTANTTTNPLFSVDIAAGIAPAAQDGMAASEFTATRILLATIAPDDSIVFATINPVRIWRLKNGVVNLVAGGGDYKLNFGSPAKQVDLGPVLGLVAGNDSVTFLSSAGSVFNIGASGFAEYQGLTGATCIGQGGDGTMYAVSRGGLYRRAPGGDWAMVPTTADLNWCTGLAVDPNGNTIVATATADRYSARNLLRITPSGEQTAVVGQIGMTPVYKGDGGPVADAGTLYPQSLVADTSGNLYFSDQQHGTKPAVGVVRKITADGTITVLPGCRNCLPAAVDSSGTLLVTVDYGISRGVPGNLFRYADSTMTPVFGPASGNTALTTWLDPHDIAMDAGGNLWVASRNRLVKIDSSGTTTVIPGRAADATDANGEPLPSSEFWALRVAVEPDGNILVSGVLPNGEKYSSDATQAAIWRYSPKDDTFENLIVLSPKPTITDPGLPMTIPATDHFIVDLAEPSNGSIYFITTTQSPYYSDRTLYVLHPDGSTEELNQYPAKALFVDAAGTLWVGELHLDANSQVTDKRPFLETASNLQMMGQAIFGDQVLLLDGAPEAPNLIVPDPSTVGGPFGIGFKVLAYYHADFVASSGEFGGAGGPLLDAKIGLTAITVSPDGTFYLADRPNQVIWKLKSQDQAQALFSQNGIVNAASFQVGSLAPDAFATVYGVFPNATPDTLTVTLTDSGGTARNVTITSANPSQLNLLIPSATAPGEGTLSIANNNGGVTWSQKVNITEIAPGLFSLPPDPASLANNFTSGFGIAAGFAIRDLGGGQQDTIPLFQASGDEHHPGTFVVNTVQLGDQPLYLSVYGTGFANAGGLENVTAEVNGVSVPVTFAGPVQNYNGLDQVNIGPLTADAILPDAPDFLQIQVKGVSSNSVEFDVH